ncbi:nucleotide pyrophosphohydrolase [Candidatus Bathyarchaeota archaeon]|nr:nucleotide pyrophosphohydrolase [Candidatus Bathyarchaeota archaeon]MBS7628485.1 nucleotide pyrophosphohydrolase [Candidatus Bathyarchaeota archaeon]
MKPVGDDEVTVGSLKDAVARFIRERGWERFHNPKNLAESICIESSELLENFQWVTTDESETYSEDSERLSSVSSELADVIIYCLAFANVLNIDVAYSVTSKLRECEGRYPKSDFYGRPPNLSKIRKA